MHPVIQKLRDYGHDKNPAIADLFDELDYSEWEVLTPENSLGKVLVLSYQLFFPGELDKLSSKHHRRTAMFDGELGPATEELLNAPRCGCPDFEAATTGSGSWRAGCLPESNGRHAVKVHYDTSRGSSAVKDWWAWIQETVENAYAEQGLWIIPTDDVDEAQIRVWFESLGGSTIGLAQLPGSGACRSSVWCKLHPRYAPNKNQVAQLLAHELGHNMNSGHISNDPIMHPSMVQKHWNGSFENTPFGNRLSGYFGGEYFRGDEEPPTDVKIIDGDLKIRVGGRDLELRLKYTGGGDNDDDFDFGG